MLRLGSAAFITAEGSSGSDTIVAGAANQTLVAEGGSDTLVGSSAFGDLFAGLSANMSAATIQGFGGSDAIDLTDMVPGSVSLAFNSGTLQVTDGTHTANIAMTGSFQTSDFAFGTDHASGTMITLK
jgi:Ca2+-binding RTX toxin-like protein